MRPATRREGQGARRTRVGLPCTHGSVTEHLRRQTQCLRFVMRFVFFDQPADAAIDRSAGSFALQGDQFVAKRVERLDVAVQLTKLRFNERQHSRTRHDTSASQGQDLTNLFERQASCFRLQNEPQPVAIARLGLKSR